MSKSRYVSGLRSVEQLLATQAAEVRSLYVEYQTANPRVEAVVQKARDLGIEVQQANRARLTQISGEARHQGVVLDIRRNQLWDEAELRSQIETKLEAGERVVILLLDGLQDPHNLGACLRTADAAGVTAVVIPRHGAAGPGPTVSKVASGAAESLPLVQVANLGRVLDWLADYGIPRLGTSDGVEESLYDADLSRNLALVMGREGPGLSHGIKERCDALLRLPMHGSVSSLNVSVATGICLYEAVRQGRIRLAAEGSSG
ncbi:MAG: 23S rRNA (guanosine(2251)-2'-O)-methyltransferase RlmB [Pseudomonadota bacterium]